MHCEAAKSVSSVVFKTENATVEAESGITRGEKSPYQLSQYLEVNVTLSNWDSEVVKIPARWGFLSKHVDGRSEGT